MKRSKYSHTARRPARTGRLLLHGIVIASCVGISALVSWIEPISLIEFSRAGPTIDSNVTELLLFVVPFRQAVIADVKTIRDELRNSTTTVRKDGRSGIRLTESVQTDAFLVIANETDEVRVPVSLVNFDNVLRRVKEFQGSDSQSQLRIVTVSKWKATIISGLLLSAAFLYLPMRIWRRHAYTRP